MCLTIFAGELRTATCRRSVFTTCDTPALRYSFHEGCSLREIQSYLGHASYLTTTRYAHVDARSKEHALEIMSAALMTGENN